MRPDTPYKAIACFDAVMRTGSATLAAERLFVTPGAVAQQLRKLEAWLGVPLFVRSVRKLHATDEALRYWAQVRPALEQIAQANAGLQGEQAWGVSVSLPPAFASTWFARRIAAFTQRHPELHLHLNATAEPVDLAGTYDLAVRHFDGVAPHLHCRLLLRDEARVYCSPAYRDRMQLAGTADLHKATLLMTTVHANWSRWLAQAGVSFDGLQASLRFDQSELAIDAARRGQGLVLTSRWLVEDDLEQGRLIQLFPQVVSTGKHYYLVHGNDSALGAGAQQLHDWLLGAAADCAGPRAAG